MKWIRLWIEETLKGTTFDELNLAERGGWFSLLILAGNSQTPGIIEIRKGKPYKLETLAELINCSVEELKTIIEKLVTVGKIKVLDDGRIQIVNWDKYQTHYEKYIKKSKNPHPTDPTANADLIHINEYPLNSNSLTDVNGDKITIDKIRKDKIRKDKIRLNINGMEKENSKPGKSNKSPPINQQIAELRKKYGDDAVDYVLSLLYEKLKENRINRPARLIPYLQAVLDTTLPEEVKIWKEQKLRAELKEAKARYPQIAMSLDWQLWENLPEDKKRECLREIGQKYREAGIKRPSKEALIVLCIEKLKEDLKHGREEKQK